MSQHRNIEFEEFLWLPIFAFKTLGLDVLQSTNSYFMKRLLNVIGAISICSYVFCYSIMIGQFPSLDFRHNMLAIMIPAGSIAFGINGNIKVYSLYANRGRVRKIYDFLKSIYPRTRRDRAVLYRVEEYFYSRKELLVTIIYLGSCYLLMVVPLFQSLIRFAYDVSVHGYDESHCKYLKFYPTEYESIINHRTPVGYTIIYILETFTCHYLIISNLGTDLWLIPFASQIRMHLDQISKDLQETHRNPKEKTEKLLKILRKHQQLMELHSELKDTFKISMAFNIIATMGLIITVALRVWINGFFKDMLLFSYLSCAILQFYILCTYGQKLAESSENVGYAAYNSEWYSSSIENKKSLIILMIRSARPATLDLIGGPPISLDTFKILMTVSYRIFAVFNSMME